MQRNEKLEALNKALQEIKNGPNEGFEDDLYEQGAKLYEKFKANPLTDNDSDQIDHIIELIKTPNDGYQYLACQILIIYNDPEIASIIQQNYPLALDLDAAKKLPQLSLETANNLIKMAVEAAKPDVSSDKRAAMIGLIAAISQLLQHQEPNPDPRLLDAIKDFNQIFVYTQFGSIGAKSRLGKPVVERMEQMIEKIKKLNKTLTKISPAEQKILSSAKEKYEELKNKLDALQNAQGDDKLVYEQGIKLFNKINPNNLEETYLERLLQLVTSNDQENAIRILAIHNDPEIYASINTHFPQALQPETWKTFGSMQHDINTFILLAAEATKPDLPQKHRALLKLYFEKTSQFLQKLSTQPDPELSALTLIIIDQPAIFSDQLGNPDKLTQASNNFDEVRIDNIKQAIDKFQMIEQKAQPRMPFNTDNYSEGLKQGILAVGMTEPSISLLLIDHMNSLGYKLDIATVYVGGLCYGFSHMLTNAILAEEEDVFIKRLADIYQKPRPAILLDRDFLQQQVLPFYDSLLMQHEPQGHSDTLGKSVAQNAAQETIDELVSSPTIESKGGKKKVFSYINLFPGQELQQFLDETRNVIREAKKNSLSTTGNEFPIVLSNQSHIIAIRYDTKKDVWIVSNTDERIGLPFPQEIAPGEIGAYIKHQGFKTYHSLGLNIEVYATSNNPYLHEVQAGLEKYKQTHPATTKRADREMKDDNNTTLAYLAASFNDLALMRKLYQEIGNDIFEPSVKERNPLHMAASFGHMQMVDFLLDKNPALINATFENGITPLHLTITSGVDINIIENLLSKNADIHLLANNRSNVLHIAADYKRNDILKMLLSRPEITIDDINAQNDDGHTPFYRAVERGNLEAVNLLIAKSADPTIPENNGFTPLVAATLAGHEIIIDRLIALYNQLNIDFKAKDRHGNTLLHYAVLTGKLDLIEKFIKLGIPLDIQNLQGYTAEKLATANNKPEIAELLKAVRAGQQLIKNLTQELGPTTPSENLKNFGTTILEIHQLPVDSDNDERNKANQVLKNKAYRLYVNPAATTEDYDKLKTDYENYQQFDEHAKKLLSVGTKSAQQGTQYKTQITKAVNDAYINIAKGNKPIEDCEKEMLAAVQRTEDAMKGKRVLAPFIKEVDQALDDIKANPLRIKR